MFKEGFSLSKELGRSTDKPCLRKGVFMSILGIGRMGLGFGVLILSFCGLVVHAAELIRVPLVQRGASSLGLRKREVGYSPLISDVVPGNPAFDLAYLGEVSIGTPPQNFLVRKISCLKFLGLTRK